MDPSCDGLTDRITHESDCGRSVRGGRHKTFAHYCEEIVSVSKPMRAKEMWEWVLKNKKPRLLCKECY